MKHIFLILFFALFFAKVHGQDTPEVIVLKKQLAVATSDSSKMRVYNKLMMEYTKTNFDSLKHYGHQALKFGEKSNDKYARMVAYHTMGTVYVTLGTNSDSAIFFFNKSVALSKGLGDKKMQTASMQNLSYIYINLNLLEKALKINLDIVNMYKDKNDTKLANAYNTLSIIFSKLHRYDEAIIYSEKAIVLAKKVAKNDQLMSCYINMSVAYTGLKKDKEAEMCLLVAKELSIKIDDKVSYATILMDLALVYIGRKEFERAKTIIKELTMPDMMAIQDPYSNCSVFLCLGGIYMDTGKLDSSEYAIKEAIKYAESVNYLVGLENAHITMSDIMAKRGDYEEAYTHLLKSYGLRDSILTEDKNRSITEMKIGYEVDRKETENQQLMQEASLKDTQIKQQYIIILTLALLLLVIVVGAIYVYRQRRTIANQREKILEQKLLQMQLNPHFIFNSLQAIQDYIYSNNEKEASRYLAKFARLMRLTLENSRHESIQLKTEIESLENYLSLQKLRMGNQLEYSITLSEDIDPSFTEIPPMLIQPFVENAVEHGIKMKNSPGYVKVEFGVIGHMLNIKVTDNGPGFEQNMEVKPDKGHHSLSMQIINERLELFGRKKKYKPNLKITNLGTTETKGTRVEINIPTEV